ncbi:Uncharacterised protein [Mycobacterium tuberculosis]|uniref:Uncharacterized protein n=2 Tax=Mycobacterium tuberculosis TaxID=1773 RepID=A0A0U0QWB3_MYCTX|nr:Uncharacterised protein [Mycobacterium tuberculosis]CFR68167.1 Uncharacterised protein [Mycobacterium tuberculosis]CFS32918.1 Uncharacterised protein [Mycobacterium tuberculosis]CFS60800.1 Uncharacterised protein [Mycobacterium tuberculosis]CKO13637.1 Uncharacterised protein [Mycobacterium tuberculosis]
MGFQSTQSALVEPLTGQQQMHAQRPAHPTDREEHVDEFGMLAQQFGKLVDDDEQDRQAGKLRTRLACPLICRDTDQVACHPQQLLPAAHLAGQCVLHPCDQRCFLGKVGDDRGYMWGSREVEKCCTTLEVDQKEVEDFGRIACHHPQRDGTQQLRFA